jgi:hypothetical protein
MLMSGGEKALTAIASRQRLVVTNQIFHFGQAPVCRQYQDLRAWRTMTHRPWSAKACEEKVQSVPPWKIAENPIEIKARRRPRS